MATQMDFETALENASEQELLSVAHCGCLYAADHPSMADQELQEWGSLMSAIAVEVERRKVEPLWRKAKRFAVRNSGTLKEIGKIAAGAAIGVSVGNSLTNY